MYALRYYATPLFLAVAIHAIAGLALYSGWQPDREIAKVVKPRFVESQLLVLDKPKVAPAKPKEAPPPPPIQRQAPPPEPAKKKTQPTPKKEEPKVDPEELRKKAEAEALAKAEQLRRERLEQLNQQSFEDLLLSEEEALDSGADEATAASYQLAIYELVVSKWSRPPSARNGMRARLLVELVPTGDVVAVSVIESSGNSAFDRSAEQAVRKARKFPVPEDPSLFERSFRKFYFLFQPEDLLR